MNLTTHPLIQITHHSCIQTQGTSVEDAVFQILAITGDGVDLSAHPHLAASPWAPTTTQGASNIHSLIYTGQLISVCSFVMGGNAANGIDPYSAN